jgi:hypothetical protein
MIGLRNSPVRQGVRVISEKTSAKKTPFSRCSKAHEGFKREGSIRGGLQELSKRHSDIDRPHSAPPLDASPQITVLR